MAVGPLSPYRCGMRDGRTMRDTSVQSVHRAISILQVLALEGAAGVTEIAAELGVHKSTVYRLVATLEARGLVVQNSERGRYRLGYGVVQLAVGAPAITSVSWVGQRTPMHATAAGKVFLAYMDPEQLDALLAEGLETYTPYTI